MMNLQRLSPVPSPLSRSVALAAGMVGLLAISGPDGIQGTSATPHKDTSSAVVHSDSHSLVQADTAMAELAESVAKAFTSLDEPGLDAVPSNRTDALPVQSGSMQLASVDPSDIEVGNPKRAVSAIEIIDECIVIEICVDRYLWALYQRAPKEDTIKVPERRSVSVKRKGKTVTVSRTFTKLVDQDFGWKDPKAAERVRMSMMDYVIGGMDPGFKLKLFHMLHAAEAAGLSPGITSAFRDDYRQSIASGLKAASNRSYHGGSLRGGYGHGVAADVVSVEGGTRNQRWASSDKLWKWVDVNGKDFGIARPYLGRDPPHVAPIDGQEYAKHSRNVRQAASNERKVKKAEVKKAHAKEKRIAVRGHSRLSKPPRTATISKPKAG